MTHSYFLSVLCTEYILSQYAMYIIHLSNYNNHIINYFTLVNGIACVMCIVSVLTLLLVYNNAT